MDIKEKRRANLKRWFEQRTIPPKEKSYLSQLLTGTASFGERAARRLESDYGMGNLYLDGNPGQDGNEPPAASVALLEVNKSPRPEDMDLMWVTAFDRALLTLAHATDEDGRKAIMRAANAVPRVIANPAVGHHQQ